MSNHSTIKAALKDLLDQYDGHISRLVGELHLLLQDLAERGDKRMVQILEAATTATGEARAARGGHPGRVETGQMRDAIGHNVSVDRDTLYAEWGWLNEVHEYFLLQEHGDDVFGVKFEGMKALLGSYIEMREELRRRLGGM